MKQESSYILLVEDNPADARIIIDYFKANYNVEVKHFTDDVDVLDYLCQNEIYESNVFPDIIILDMNLPKVSGLDVLKKIKTDSKLKRIPVIVFGTSSDHLEIKEVYNNYANGYIIKPIDLDELDDVLRHIAYFWLELTTLP
ncbi:response regulator [Methanobacterium sp. ACI-7]|uniref:response regulator n=1 Tax=unclassified Methanobacterium TaxID=2627676 RepID=UPI0039C15C1A